MAYPNTVSPDQIHSNDTTKTPLPVVRQSVKALLLESPAYQELDPKSQRNLAHKMVDVCQTAVGLILEEMISENTVRALEETSETLNLEDLPTGENEIELSPPLATAQSAADDHGGKAIDRLAGNTRRVINAVSFPRFVAELINGVFKAIVDSDMQQMHMYIELLNNVAASTEGFADTNMAPSQARTWLVERFPDSFELTDRDRDNDDFWGDHTPQNTTGRNTTIRLLSGAKMPSQEALQASLGLDDKSSLPTRGDPEKTLLPFVRRHLAKTRQQMLATLVQMGLRRIVIESGRINATMRFHIDARSAAQADKGNRFDMTNKISVKGGAKVGPWGVDAQLQNTIGYVSTERSHTTEEENVNVELTSSVELNFKSDYIPLNRLANSNQAQKIVANSRNSEFENARKQEATRRAKIVAQDADRRRELDKQLSPKKQASVPTKKVSNPAKKPTKATSSPTKKPLKSSRKRVPKSPSKPL
ncbi:MAG: hypothetical protein AAF821_08210 [Cyanobacteria bacterium P01_D01_bin.156]